MDKKIILIIILCVFLCASLALNGTLIFTLGKDLKIYQQAQANKKILDFRDMFTEDVLLSDQPIDFDTRLSLETAVRALNDAEIFNQWQEFTSSQTKEDATVQAKKLLDLLIKKTAT